MARGLDVACLAFLTALQTCPNYIIYLNYQYTSAFFPCTAFISPLDGVWKAKSILAFLHDFYESFILVHMNTIDMLLSWPPDEL